MGRLVNMGRLERLQHIWGIVAPIVLTIGGITMLFTSDGQAYGVALIGTGWVAAAADELRLIRKRLTDTVVIIQAGPPS